MSAIEFRRAVPNLPVKDAKASITFFTEKMGFTMNWDDAVVGTPKVMYASLSRGDFQICVDEHAAQKAGTAAIWCYVSDVRGLYEELKAKGVTLHKEPEEMPWGEIELDIKDLDGNGICFTQPTPKATV
jgi:uncharacterized glyoxalase superfamily protein PhnB